MKRLAGTLKRSLARGVLIVGLVAAVPALLFGAPPYSQNTSGTTIDGVLSALTDIYNRLAGNAGTVTQSTVSITNASTMLAAAAAFGNFAKVCLPASAASGIWVNWAGAAAVTAPPSEYMAPGQCDSWVKSTGYLPTQQWNAISSSASTIAVTIEGN